ncbi:MAG: bifunctional riboflavin kinase/FAD synthetase [Clostridium sp.]|jgi:riboflavin kinase/FMN adenylyltransferase|nr:bifunctional riboflavin kinase/FAD synthetase [Clostridium sp.]
MKVVYGTDECTKFIRPTGIGLGNFDGLHVGHLALINTLITESIFNSFDSVLYTFSKHTENIINKKLHTPLVITNEKKIQLLKRTRLDYLYFEKFDEAFSKMKPETFVKDILIKRLNMKLAVAGFNYRFGHRGEGDVDLLRKLGKDLGFRVIIIEPIKQGDDVVSSTLVRKNILKGDMGRVFELLGRHYSVTGIVEKGRRVGNTIGFPTANISPENELVLPPDGVYISKTCIDGKIYPGITNIGKNPTFGGLDKRCIETHILNFENRDIYGKKIEVFLMESVRGEKKFDSVQQLIEQVKRDVEVAKNYFHL